MLVAAFLYEDVQDLTFVINGAPHEYAFSVDADDHLIEMPDGTRARTRSPDIARNGFAELFGPAADRLVGDIDTPLGQDLFNIPQAEGEPIIQPYRLADHLGREPVPLPPALSSYLSRQSRQQLPAVGEDDALFERMRKLGYL